MCALAAFSPCLGNGFVWDDRALIIDNDVVAGLDPARLLAMFSGSHVTTYMPLGWLAFAAIRAIWGLAPAAFHAASLAAHWLAACAFFAVCRRLYRLAGVRGADGAALASAALFCAHPLQTSTVAWAIELPDILSTFFFLCAIFVYLGGRNARRLAVCAALFAVSLLFRWKSASLPIVLLALDWRPLRRKAWLEKAPFAALSLAAVAATFLAKRAASYSAALAPAAACRGLLLFAWKLVCPFPQLAVYELSGPGGGLGVPAAAAVAAVAALSLGAWHWRRRAPAVWAAWLCYAAAVLPSTLMAHDGAAFVYLPYGYLACLALFALAGAGLPRLAVAALVVVCCAASRGEAPVWKDSVTFWTRAWILDPQCRVAYGNLGGALIDRGRYNDAYFFLSAQLAYNPGDPVAGANMKVLEARAPDLRPDLPAFWTDEAADLLSLGRAEDAARFVAKALSRRPDMARAHRVMADAAAALGRTDEAARHEALAR